MKKLLTFAAFILCGITTQAQMHFSSGGTSNNSFPFNSTSSNKVQWIYLPSDFSGTPAPGIITKVYFRTTSTGFPKTFTDLTIKMGYTTASNTVTGAYTTGLTTVHSSTSFTASVNSGGWVEIPLTTPFYYTFSSNIIVEASQNGYTSGFTVSQNSSGGNKRLYGGLASATGTAGTGLADFGFDKVPAGPNNAGVFEVTEPVGACAGTYPLKVRVKNNGNNAINNVQIHWTLDGVAQTPVNYATTIPSVITSVNNSAIVTIGSITLSNVAKNIKVWTTLPNGVADTVNLDDTLSKTMKASLAGVYTIGGTAPDYPNLSDAVSDLNDFGICGPVTFNVRDGIYSSQGSLNQVSGASATNRITFQAEAGASGNVNISFASTGAGDNYVLRLNNASYVTVKNLTFSNSGASFCRALEFVGNASYDSILNCRFIGTGQTASSINTSVLYGADLLGDGNVIKNNTVQNGSYTLRIEGTGTTALAQNWIIDNNEIIDGFGYSVYLYYTNNTKFRNNVISTPATGTYYGIYAYYNDNALEMTGNKIIALGSGIKYGINLYYSDGTASVKGLVANNIISVGDGSAAAYGLRNQYSSYLRIYNNSVRTNGDADGAAGYFYYSSTTYTSNDIRNNIFYEAGAGHALYMYNPDPSYNTTFDYNNIYTEGTDLVQRGTPAEDYQTLDAWRRASGMDMNSIAYNPGFTNTSNLTPDATNPASWSVNGRGVHIAGNDKDFNAATRVTALAAGVPDLGAYEFTPTATPPAAEAIPAVPAAGITQYFLFGQDTVAAIDWATISLIPNSVTVRQYTGTVAPQLTSVTGTSFMYFYTDIDVPASTYNFNTRIYYKDPWRGTLGAESNTKMIRKVGSSPWVAFNDNESNVNTTRNFISASALTRHGYFTGIDNGTVFSAHVRPQGKVVFCPGGTVTLQATPTGGTYSYQWKINGSPIPGAVLPTYAVQGAGIYEVEVTSGTQVAATTPVEIYVVQTPSALVTPSGSTRFCAGGSVTLNVQTSSDAQYQWKKNGVSILGATTPVYTVSDAGIYTVQVTNKGCAATSTATATSIGAPVVNLGRDTTFCQHTAVVLNAGNPGAQYVWSTGDTSRTISINSNTSGTYSVRVIAGPGCETEDTISLTVDPMPTVVGISYVRAGNNFQLSPSGVQNANRYLWIFGDGKTDTSRVITYDYVNRPKVVKLVVFNGCGSDTAEANLSLSVNDAGGVKNVLVNVYPNPAQNMMTGAMEGDAQMKDITVLNHLGQVVYRASAEVATKEQRIDVGNLPSGHYILRVNTTDSNVISKQFDVLR